jgi:hypothetical protein
MQTMRTIQYTGFHNYELAAGFASRAVILRRKTRISYVFEHNFHPYAGAMRERLNRRSLDGLLDPAWQAQQREIFFDALYQPAKATKSTDVVDVVSYPKRIDVDLGGPYAGYNWELLFHVPFTIAVYLSDNRHYAEAQRWFHRIFDPTSTDTSVEPPDRYWRFLGFRGLGQIPQLDQVLALLSKRDDQCSVEELEQKRRTIAGYEELQRHPFSPHVVARTRISAYQRAVVMKYLTNLIAWADSLFRQDTAETVAEATQLYVLAANILGPRPQIMPPAGRIAPKTYAQLKAAGLDTLGNALVDLEVQFPFNLYAPQTGANPGVGANAMPGAAGAAPLFGIARTLYFCIPPNRSLLDYWDVVADRLFKIRHCMNIEGVVRQLPLFEPPIDPGMLVKAAAAGIDVTSLVAGTNQPLSPVRASLLITKALEICAEVRSLGSALLQALEKGDGETLALLRQGHEVGIATRMRDTRFLQMKEAEEATALLLRSRETIFDRYRHYQLLLGKTDQDLQSLSTLTLTRPAELTEDNFDEVYSGLVTSFASAIALEPDTPPAVAGAGTPQGAATGPDGGALLLSDEEDRELNDLLPAARRSQEDALALDSLFGVLGMLPNFGVDLQYWGLGGHIEFGGVTLSSVGRILSGIVRGDADKSNYDGSRAAKTAGYQRRANDWAQLSNAAAHELMQNGRQIIAGLIHEQITRHEYDTQVQLLTNATDIETTLREKFSNAQLYGWMQGELSRLFHDCYGFAFDVARRAERTMKRELMRPEIDERDFVSFGHWDAGRRGLLAGEGLYLDVKRMELAYQEANKREYELVRHVSLAQLDPVALLALKATGRCEVSVPEWLFDLDCPGHYMRRLKSAALTIPAVTGPYTSVHATVSLLRSSIRRSPLLNGTGDDPYARDGVEDDRFVDYAGAIPAFVTSTANADSGLFETLLRDERYLPAEGYGAIGTWRIELPDDFRQFDYATIADVVLHLRYTAREGGEPLRQAAVGRVGTLVGEADQTGLARLFSLRHDFPSEWYAFTTGAGNFTATLRSTHFPYFTRAKNRAITLTGARLYALRGTGLTGITLGGLDLDALSTGLGQDAGAALSLPRDQQVLVADDAREVFLVLTYTLT